MTQEEENAQLKEQLREVLEHPGIGEAENAAPGFCEGQCEEAASRSEEAAEEA